MRSAGVKDPTSSAAVGCISRGVADLWRYDGGEAKLSTISFSVLYSLQEVDNVQT